MPKFSEPNGGIPDLINRIRRSRGTGPSNHWGGGLVLVGAGCSVSAGIPTAAGIVDLALRHLGKTRLQQADADKRDPKRIYEDLITDGLRFTNKYGPDLYYEIFDEHLDESNEQRTIIKQAIELGQGKINWAHIRLGQLVAERCVHTVITTNFDRLAQEGMRRASVIPAVADGLEALNSVDPNPAIPQVIHLHGSVYNYSIRNSRRHVSEVGNSTPARGALYELLHHAPFLLVVGYRGEEEGLMQPLREALIAFPERRVFWALHGDMRDAPEPVRVLYQTGCIITFLQNTDADDLFDILASGANLGPPSWIRNPITSLLRDQADVVSPTRPDVGNLLRKHGAELDALANYLASYRQRHAIEEEEDGAASSSLRRSIHNDVVRALSKDEFFLQFQPILSLASNRIVGGEALLRWQHPLYGLLLPAQFLPIAEDAGLITSIGNWVIRSACKLAEDWPTHVGVAVNVSPAQFRDGSVLRSVTEILNTTDFSPDRLELEITEASVLESSSTVVDELWQLHGLGTKISLDDFGTGYSSLSYLRRFPFDRIKIDRSLTQNVVGEQSDSTIILAIIDLADSMNMSVTAEGVETAEQASILTAFGCGLAQGFLFSPPLSAADFLQLLRTET